LAEEGSPLLSRTKEEATHPDLLGRKEKLRIGRKRVYRLNSWGLLVITAVQIDPTRGSTGALDVRGDFHSWAMGNVKEV
jgi:hypothetical protein